MGGDGRGDVGQSLLGPATAGVYRQGVRWLVWSKASWVELWCLAALTSVLLGWSPTMTFTALGFALIAALQQVAEALTRRAPAPMAAAPPEPRQTAGL